MQLLPMELQEQLPPFHSQLEDPNPWVLARLYVEPPIIWSFYVIDGGPSCCRPCVFSGLLVTRRGFQYRRFDAHDLEHASWGAQQIQMDRAFVRSRLSDVMNANNERRDPGIQN